MSDSKVFMFPEGGYNNNNGFGLGGWGGGILGFILGALIMTTGLNTGMTFSNSAYKTSLVCIGRTSSKELFVNTVVHEAKHVLSHICQYYNIKEDGETAAYLIGHIVLKMYRNLMKVEYRYYD